MTQQQFEQLWKNGTPVDSSMNVDMPAVNFSSFPEDVTDVKTSGVYFGIHFAFDNIQEFYDDYLMCMFAVDSVENERINIQRRKDSHGEHVYLIKVVADDDSHYGNVLEVEHGNEYRAWTCNCIIRKVSI